MRVQSPLAIAIALTAVLFCPGPSRAAEQKETEEKLPPPKAGAAKDVVGITEWQKAGFYVVKDGDTCSAIAAQVWPGDPQSLERLHALNPLGPLPHHLVTGSKMKTVSNDPDATLSFLKPDVNIRKSTAPDWGKGAVGQGLFHLDQVSTLAGAAAEVRFRDKSSLQLDQNALVVVYGYMPGNKAAERSGAVQLVQGDLRLHLAAMRGEAGMSVSTPSAEISAKSNDTAITVDQSKMSRVSVFHGTAEVKGSGKLITLQRGYGTRVEEGKEPEAAQPLPPAPGWATNGPRDLYLATGKTIAVSIKWKDVKGAAKYRLELAPDDTFNTHLLDAAPLAAQPRWDMAALPVGRYYARVSAVTEAGLLGLPSPVKRLDVLPLKVEAGAPGAKPNSLTGAVEIRLRLPEGEAIQATIDNEPASNPVVVKGFGHHTVKLTGGNDAVSVYDCEVVPPQSTIEFGPGLTEVIVKFFDPQGHPASFGAAPELGIQGIGGTRVGLLQPEGDGHVWKAPVKPSAAMSNTRTATIRVTWKGKPIGEGSKDEEIQ